MKIVTNDSSFLIEARQNEFEIMKVQLIKKLQGSVSFARGKWQSETTSIQTKEIWNAIISYNMPSTVEDLRHHVPADFEWADEHFKERIGGKPLNPAPSYLRWPYHSAAQAQRHIDAGVFSHTYPERMWPRQAGDNVLTEWGPDFALGGIRYTYGDTADVVKQLIDDPFTRQAYLPIWFPEDTGSTAGQRVPCTLGYHFIRNAQMFNCNYFIRSCDIYRHFTNDIYMAVRLAQWINNQVAETQDSEFPPMMGTLTMFVSNLHMFVDDIWRFSV